jgi:hypothetical protein
LPASAAAALDSAAFFFAASFSNSARAVCDLLPTNFGFATTGFPLVDADDARLGVSGLDGPEPAPLVVGLLLPDIVRLKYN